MLHIKLSYSLVFSVLKLLPFFILAALEFLKSRPQDPISQSEFDEACGVGIVITPEQIEDAVSAGFLTDRNYTFAQMILSIGVFSDSKMMCRSSL